MNFWDALRAWLLQNRRSLERIGAIAGAIILLPVVGLMMVPTILGLFAPTIDVTKDLYSVNRPIAFTFLDAEGHEAGHRGAIVGQRLSLEEMPAYLPAAFIAMEDRSFYSNSGISIRGLIRATLANMRAHHVVAGGSTITQQTAKIVFTSQERTFSRKIQELFDTAALNKSLSKKQILELYLNRIYLGSGAYGVDGAAHVYFGKSARDLSLSEAAMLATLTTAPSVFSPRRDLARAQVRAVRVLRAMVDTGAITEAQADEAAAHPAQVTNRAIVDARNYYFDTAADEATRLVTVNGQTPNEDLIVHTTFEPAIEDAARKAIDRTLDKSGHKMHVTQSAAVVMKLDGAVAALMGGRDYDESVFNRATLAHRQPGSAFKPFVYLAAVENGISPWDVRDDGPVDIDGWQPTNYGGRSYGTVTLAQALAHSINTVTAGLAQEVGITTVMEAAQRCGITSPLQANASLALGTSEVTPFEITSAYATFASGGMKVTPYFVTEVDGRSGHILYRRTAPEPERVVADHVNRDMVAMLAGVVTDGTGRAAAVAGHETAGKTGTTQDYHDAWFVGFTKDYVAAVWVGNDDMAPMKNVTGGSLPAQIWNSIMTVAEKGLPSTPLDKSAPEEATDTSGGAAIATDDENGASITDDESAGAPRQVEERKSFWDWLFGNGGSQSGAQQSPPHDRAAVPERRGNYRDGDSRPREDSQPRDYSRERDDEASPDYSPDDQGEQDRNAPDDEQDAPPPPPDDGH